MNPAARSARVIALIDMDCFYCQVEQREKPELWGKPVAVVQYNQFRGGGIIAMSYEARACGVLRRGMRGDKAKELCPDLTICRVPISQFAEKAELAKYRDASAEVFDVLCNFDERILVERASVDEAYLDLTAIVDAKEKEEDFTQKFLTSSESLPNTHVANGVDAKNNESYDREQNLKDWLTKACQKDRQQLRLAIGAVIVEEIRAKIRERTQFHCSAGIGPNKVLAKLVCSRHKPRQQTVIAPEFTSRLFESTKIGDIRGLGGKLGQQLTDRYGVKTISELAKVNRVDLAENFPHSANFIELICQGIDDEPVRPRDKQLSIAVSRNFTGKAALCTVDEVKNWLRCLVNDLCARLVADQEKNKRTAQSLSCGCTQEEQSIRTTAMNSYDNESVFKSAWALLQTFNKSSDNKWLPPVKNIHVSAHHFREGIEKPTRSITTWFAKTGGKKKDEKSVGAATKEEMDTEAPEADTSTDVSSDRSFIFEEEDDEPVPSTSKTSAIEEPIKPEADDSDKVEDIEMGKETEKKPRTSSRGAKSGTARTKKKENKGESDTKDLLPESFESISEAALESLPRNIRNELMAYYNEKDQRPSERKPGSASPKTPKLAKASKRVQKKATTKKTKAGKSPPKKISDFFGKQ